MAFPLEPLQPGQPLDLVDTLRRDRNRRPMLGGQGQQPTVGGWHALSHAGAFEARVIADYQSTPYVLTQAGAGQRELYLEHISYREVAF